MFRNLTIINYEGAGVGISHDRKTGNCVVREFDIDAEYSSNGALAIAANYLDTAVDTAKDSKIDKIEFSIVSLDDVCIKGFSCAKVVKEKKAAGQEATVDDMLDYLVRDFHEEEAIFAITDFVEAYHKFISAGHVVNFRKMSDVEKTNAPAGTYTATQKQLLNQAWDIVMPQKELVFNNEESVAGGLF